MRSTFDRRVLSDSSLDFVRACQRRVDCHLAGGAALAGAFLGHRVSRDIDLFCHDPVEHRVLAADLASIAREVDGRIQIQRDGGSFLRAALMLPDHALLLDVVHEAQPDIEPPPPPIEEIVVESLVDLRAAKLTCILSRREPRDLVDLLFLERAGFPPERDLGIALRKDAGIDPAILAWLLAQFPVEPLPEMLVGIDAGELRAFRDALAERLRRLATMCPGC